MTSESKTWRNLRTEYLHQVEKALSSVRHPRAHDVLEDVGGHLDKRLAELTPEQRNAETLRAIITDMGPPADYAVLLDSGDAGGPPRDRKYSLAWAGGVAMALVVVIALISHALLGRGAGQDEAAADESANIAQLIADLSDPEAPRFVALNKLIRIGGPAVPALIEEMETSYNWQIPKALGAIGDRRAIGPLIEKLQKSDLSPMREVIVEALGRITGQDIGPFAEEWRTWWEQTGPDESGAGSSENVPVRAPNPVPVYIVTFRPSGSFHPQAARALLEAFNENHPRGVRTHHYRTEVRDKALIGYICVDTEAGKNAVVAMLNSSDTLELVEAVLAGPEALEQHNNRKQVSLSSARDSSSGSRRTSRRVKEPTSYNRTVTRTGTWPPGDCFVYGHVSRRARLSRADNAKVCLSSDEFGSWVVEVRGNGSVDFRSLPPGSYRLYTTDTVGYRDTYYNPLSQAGARPTFVLKEGDRTQLHIEIEPIRPYRKIIGRVLDENGNILSDCEGLTVSAWVQRPQGDWKGHYRVLSRSAVQADGSYLLDDLDGRPVYVQVRDGRPPVQEKPYPPRFHPGTFSRDEADLVTFDEEAVVEDIDIALQRAGGLILEGVVTDEKSGQPVAETLVTVFHHDMFFDLFYTYTDEQGRYCLEGLGAGQFIVHVDAVHQGYVKTRKMVTVASSGPQRRLDFTLRPGANISGTFVDEKGQPYQVGRSFGGASRKKGGFAGRASNFSYGNKYAPEPIRLGSTVFYEEGEGDGLGTKMAFPSETSFLIPAVAVGEVVISFRPRGPGEHVTKMLYQGRNVLKTGLTVKPNQDVTDVTIVVERPESS